MSSSAAVAVTRSNSAPAVATPAVATQTQSGSSAGAMQSVTTPAVSLLATNPRERNAANNAGNRVTGEKKSKSLLGGLWDSGTKWLGETVDKGIEFSENLMWKGLEELAPELVPIFKQGPLEWLKEKISAAVDSVFESLMSPVRTIADVAQVLRGHFAKLMEWMTDAAAKIAKGDCKPIAEAADKIYKVFEGIAAPIVDRIKGMADKVTGFFSGMWERFGAPIWDFLKKTGGQAWEKIQQLGKWIWEKTAPIRAKLDMAWTWIKKKLGVGEGPEGQDGLLQWVQSKAAMVWEQHIKPFVEKYKKPLMVAAGIIALLSPAGPFLAIGGAVAGIVAGINWIRTKLAKRGGAAEDRGVLEKTILPAITNAVDKVSSFLSEKARVVTETIGKVVSGLGGAISVVAGSIFKFAVSAFQWLMDRFNELVAWAREMLGGLFTWIKTTLQRLKAFAQPLLDFLKEVGRVAVDIMTFPAFVAGALWKLIPECIRDPFVDFLVNQVLKRVPILKDVIEAVPKIWAKVKTTALMLIRMVFKEGNLKGALFEIFKLVLEALDIPLDLIKSIIAKAGAAQDMILANPLGFLGNLLAAIKQGFIQFGEKILTHLGKSIVGWFNGVLKSAGLQPPTDFSLKGIFEFILGILGITLEKVMARIEEKIGKEAADKIRQTISVISKVWEWLSTLINEGPMGVWNKLTGELGDLWNMLLDSAIGWVTETVTKIALPRITAALGTAPVGAVIEAIVLIYKVIQTAAEYARRVLEIVSSVLDAVTAIAKGTISGAADLVEKNLGLALTVVIGFLANYLGLGGLGKKIKEIVAGIQKKVEKAIDFVIDKAIAIGKSVINSLTKAAKGLLAWWKEPEPFKNKEGEDHTIFIEGDYPNEKVFVKSTKTLVDDLIKEVSDSDKAEAKKIKKEIEKILGDEKTTHKNVKAVKDAEKILKVQLKALALLLPVSSKPKPPTFEFKTSGRKAEQASVKNLSAFRPRGSSPSDSGIQPKGWEYAQKTGLTGIPPGLRRLHLINDRFGGPGSWENLAVAGKHDNENKHRAHVEDKIKEYVGKEPNMQGKNAILNYIVTAEYGRKSKQLVFKGVKANIADYPSAYICKIEVIRAPNNIKEIPSGWPTKKGEIISERLDFDNDWEYMLEAASDKNT